MDTAVLSRNLAALRALQPEVAEGVASASVAAVAQGKTVVPATGRDGVPTFRLCHGNGRSEWFGQSSTPSISAVETVGRSAHQGGNVALPGVLTGQEPLVVANRCPSHCAVFVIHDGWLPIRLAMSLYDYTELFANGRLVYLSEQNLAEDMRRFFEQHPGYEIPATMFAVPQRSAVEITELQGLLTRASVTLAQVQERALSAAVAGIPPPAPRTAAGLRVAIISRDARSHVIEHARRYARACTALGWTCELCVPDAPGKCHAVARARAIARCSPDMVLYLGAGPDAFCRLLPVDLPIATVHPDGEEVPVHELTRLRPRDCLCAGREAILALRQHVEPGNPNGRLVALDPAADTVIHRMDIRSIPATPASTQRSTPISSGRASPVAILMDVPDDRPHAAGINQATHIRLWSSLRRIVLSRADEILDGDMHAKTSRRCLQDAESQSGVTIRDRNIREWIMNQLRQRLLPVAVANATYSALADVCDGTTTYGSGWVRANDASHIHRGEIPTGVRLNELAGSRTMLVLPWYTTRALQTALDALAAGAIVVCAFSGRLLFQTHPGLSPLVPHLGCYATVRELRRLVSDHLSHAGGMPAPCSSHQPARRQPVWDLIHAGHSVVHQLQTIADACGKEKADITHCFRSLGQPHRLRTTQ